MRLDELGWQSASEKWDESDRGRETILRQIIQIKKGLLSLAFLLCRGWNHCVGLFGPNCCNRNRCGQVQVGCGISMKDSKDLLAAKKYLWHMAGHEQGVTKIFIQLTRLLISWNQIHSSCMPRGPAE